MGKITDNSHPASAGFFMSVNCPIAPATISVRKLAESEGVNMKSGMKLAKLRAFETARLKLRFMTEDEWYDIVINTMFTNEFELLFAHEKSEEFCEKISKPAYDKMIYYSIHHSKTDVLIGYVGYNTKISYIEYYIIKEHRHFGYAFEAVETLIEMLFDGLILGKPIKELHAWTLWYNKPSEQLLLKLGFHSTGYRVFDDGTAGQFFTYGPGITEDIA